MGMLRASLLLPRSSLRVKEPESIARKSLHLSPQSRF